MGWIKCKKCGVQVNSKLEKCPMCCTLVEKKSGTIDFPLIIGGAIGYVIVHYLPIGSLIPWITGALAGLLVGFIPYFVAKKRNENKIGGLSLFLCVLTGAALGLLGSAPMALVCTIYILIQKQT